MKKKTNINEFSIEELETYIAEKKESLKTKTGTLKKDIYQFVPDYSNSVIVELDSEIHYSKEQILKAFKDAMESTCIKYSRGSKVEIGGFSDLLITNNDGNEIEISKVYEKDLVNWKKT